MQKLKKSLENGIHALGLELSEKQIQQIMNYLDLLQKWNKVFNLTAVRSPQEMLTHHMLDSLSVVPALKAHIKKSQAKTLLDVGSGGGLPGVVFAICLPYLQVSCVDTVGKKAAFIQQTAADLGLPHLSGIHARVEDLQEKFDIISCRAFASLQNFTDLSRQSLNKNGVWLAMKGKYPKDEIADLTDGVHVFHVEQLQVPGLDAERCLVWMRI